MYCFLRVGASDKLLEVWRDWHDIVGPPIRPLFENYVNLVNQGMSSIRHYFTYLSFSLSLQLPDCHWCYTDRVLDISLSCLQARVTTGSLMRVSCGYQHTISTPTSCAG